MRLAPRKVRTPLKLYQPTLNAVSVVSALSKSRMHAPPIFSICLLAPLSLRVEALAIDCLPESWKLYSRSPSPLRDTAFGRIYGKFPGNFDVWSSCRSLFGQT